MYRRDSLFYYALNSPMPSISYKAVKGGLAFLIISLFIQLKYSRQTRDWAASMSHKVLLVGTIAGIVGLALTAATKLQSDRSLEDAKREERLKERAYQKKLLRASR